MYKFTVKQTVVIQHFSHSHDLVFQELVLWKSAKSQFIKLTFDQIYNLSNNFITKNLPFVKWFFVEWLF